MIDRAERFGVAGSWCTEWVGIVGHARRVGGYRGAGFHSHYLSYYLCHCSHHLCMVDGSKYFHGPVNHIMTLSGPTGCQDQSNSFDYLVFFIAYLSYFCSIFKFYSFLLMIKPCFLLKIQIMMRQISLIMSDSADSNGHILAVSDYCVLSQH